MNRQTMDFFSILGIAPDASAGEIKRAYRRQAMAWHPDRSSHPEATERFKLIRAAYAALQNRGGSEEAAETPAGASAMARASDIRLDLEVALEEAAFGCAKDIVFERGIACGTCGGSGEAGVSRSRPCQGCHGSGRIRRRQHGLEICPQCGGRGYFSQRVCPDCSGRGKHCEKISLTVAVPAGMSPGDELRLVGQGEPGVGGVMPGDLFLRLGIRRHALFELHDCELSYAMPVNGLKLLAGGNIDVLVLGGVESVELEAGEIAPRTLRLAGRGYPGRRAAQAGDLVVHLQPVMPQRWDGEPGRLVRQAAEACELTLGECLPEIAAWRQHHGV